MSRLISGDRVIGRAELMQRARRVASGLRAKGVEPEDRIALFLRNDFAFFEATFAASLIGARVVPVNWHYTPHEARYVFEDSGSRVIVIHSDLLSELRGAIPDDVLVLVVETPQEIIDAYALSPAAPSWRPAESENWEEFVTQNDPLSPADEEKGPPRGAILYTSGTTGRPKGVRRAAPTPEQFEEGERIAALAYGFDAAGGEAPDVVTLVSGPMYHAAPNRHALLSVRRGATVILQPRFDAQNLLYLIQTWRVTHLHVVPIMFVRLLALPDVIKRQFSLSSLEFVAHGAAPCAVSVKRAMLDWWGLIIHEYYGSTETGMVTRCSAHEWVLHPRTVGRPPIGTQVVVVGADGESVPAGDVGEILAKAPGTADFTYHGDDEKRRSSERNGLIATGDIGYFDQDGFLYICDRSKDMIISGGVNIYPAEIEAELMKMVGVADCAVFGVPDEEFGEAVYAVVQPAAAVSLTASAVRTFLKERMAGFKVPRHVEFRHDLPREDSGKIFKRKMRDPFWAAQGRSI